MERANDTLNGLVPLTRTGPGSNFTGLPPNIQNANPYFLANEEPKGAFNYLLNRNNGQVSTTRTDATTSISGADCLIQAAKSTSTPGLMAAPGTATYTITVSNPSGSNRPEAREVVITDDSLPAGFTHTAVPITPVYTGGASGPASVTSTGTKR